MPLLLSRIIKTILLVTLTLPVLAQDVEGEFKSAQKKHHRVKKAYETKYNKLKKEIETAGFDVKNFELFIRAFKYEKELQVWMKNKGDNTFKLFKIYAICQSSGDLGPKRKEGDGQVPEGFYEIESFNPASSYHLSMKVNYPNGSDRKKATGRTGGDIMIHGECVTIGCIPIENEPIEELYILCVESKNRKNKISVNIFPCKFTGENEKMLSKNYAKEKLDFWNNLKPGYTYFEENFKIPKVTIDKAGNYVLVK